MQITATVQSGCYHNTENEKKMWDGLNLHWIWEKNNLVIFKQELTYLSYFLEKHNNIIEIICMNILGACSFHHEFVHV